MLRLRAWDMDHFVTYSVVMDDAILSKFEIKFLKFGNHFGVLS